ncbi:hypothetical protein CAAN3_26S00650 [[Candida] anglica]
MNASKTRSLKMIQSPSPVRDITAFIFILLALPSAVSCVALLMFILSGSSISLGGRFIIRRLLTSPENGFSFEFPGSNSRSVNVSVKRWSTSAKAVAINVAVSVLSCFLLPENFTQYLVLFAKAIVASELVGSTSVASTTVTSITSVTSNGGTSTQTTTTTTTTTNNSNHSNGNNTSTALTPHSTSTSASTAPAPKRVSSHEGTLRNNRFVNAVLCFLAVININYFIKEWFLSSELCLILSSLASRVYFSTSIPSDSHLEDSYLTSVFGPSKISQRSFFEGLTLRVISNTFGITNLYFVSKILRMLSISINFVYLLLCVHVIVINISPTLRRFILLEDTSRSLDNLSNISGNVPSIDFKRNHNYHQSNEGSLTPLNDDSTAIINVEQQENQNLPRQLREINLSKEISESNAKFDSFSNQSVVAGNFDTYCTTPFTTKNPNVSSIFETFKPQKVIASDGVTNSHHNLNRGQRQRSGTANNSINTTQMHNTSSSLHTTSPSSPTSSTNSTTIVNKVLTSEVTVQPFWSLLAAIKTLIFRPEFFAGKLTECKNNGGKFISPLPDSSFMSLSTVFIDDTKAVFKVLDQGRINKLISQSKGLKIKLNDVDWIHMNFFQGQNDQYFICIYGLTPLFQYELDIFENDKDESNIKEDHLVARYIFNTISSTSRTVLNQSPETTSLMTLQLSLTSTIERLHQSRSKLKKYKRDENRKIADMKRDIENLKGKISKYNTKHSTSDIRVSGKLKGLQHSVMQLEHEIDDLKTEISNIESESQKEENAYEAQERQLRNKIKDLDSANHGFESSISKYKTKLKQLDIEYVQQVSKHDRLVSKKQHKCEELNKVLNEIKNTKKNELIQKSQKRNKRFQERYEVVLPNLSNAISEMQMEIDELLGKDEDERV